MNFRNIVPNTDTRGCFTDDRGSTGNTSPVEIVQLDLLTSCKDLLMLLLVLDMLLKKSEKLKKEKKQNKKKAYTFQWITHPAS